MSRMISTGSGEEPTKRSIAIDIVIPFYNGLHLILPCLESVFDKTESSFRLIVIDDGSDPYPHQAVDSWLKSREETRADSEVILWTQETNRGYLNSVNLGVQKGTSEIVILVNSDVVLTHRWDVGLRECLESSPDVGVVSPLSNHANFTRFGMPGGWTLEETAAEVRRLSPRHYPDIGIASGFCMAAKRDVYRRIGLYDPAYGRGYYEESDWCLRAAEAGYRVVADDATFVYHTGWATFRQSGRNHWLERNAKIFGDRWGRAHDLYKERYLQGRPFAALSQALQDLDRSGPLLSLPPLLAKAESKACQRVEREEQEEHQRAGRPRWKPRKRGIINTYKRFSSKEWRRLGRARPSLGNRPGSSSPSVLFLLPGFGPYGGVISVVQLANRLGRRGIDCRLAVRAPLDPGGFREPLYSQPFEALQLEDIWNHLPPADVVVSTRWDTVYDAVLLKRRWGSELLSFVQDYEPDFLEADDPRRAFAEDSLALIEPKVVKTQWLGSRLKPFGGVIHHIPLGLDLGVFYPQEPTGSESPRPQRVVSATRPKAHFRNFEGTLRVFRKLVQRRPSVQVQLYGQPVPEDFPPVEFEHMGVLTQNEVSRLLRDSDALLDLSLFQGFGRPGLEAMACGVPSVLTREGGIVEYSRDGENCLQVDPLDEESAMEKLVEILDQPELRERLTKGGLETASQYSADKEAQRWEKLIDSLVHGDGSRIGA